MTELEGRTIEEVRPMTDAELEAEHWNPRHQRPPVMVLDDGTKLYPSQDPEGNGPGALFGDSDGELIQIGFKKKEGEA